MQVVPPLTGHLDMALSNFVKGYRQGDMLQDWLFPRLPVPRVTDRYWVYGRENLQATEQTLRAFGTAPQETRFSLSTETYFCQSNALSATIADEDRDTYTVGDLTTDTVATLQDKNLLSREYRAQALALNPASYSPSNVVALSGGSKWSDYVNSDPIGDFARAKRQIRLAGVKANIAMFSDDVFTALTVHPKLREYFKYTTVTGPLDEGQVATALGVPKIVVGSAISNDGTANNSFVWNQFAGLYYVPPSVGAPGLLGGIGAEGTVGPRQLSWGKSFTWMAGPGTVDGYGVIVSRAPNALQKSDLIGVDWYTDDHITGADCGFLFSSPI